MQPAVLTELIDAVSRCHNETTITRAALSVLRARWGVRSLEIVLAGSGERARRFVATTEGDSVGEALRVPLVDVAGANGHLLFIRNGSTPSPESIALVATVLAAALRQARAIGRVADVSRRAHARSRELDEYLKEVVLPSSIVATSPSMRRVFTEVIPLVARQTTTVLVTGETGTGKELVARRVHELSPRARRPFVRVNCGAIPSELVESTLFGHERGSFTGALGRHIGVFERAQGGTLFLDEIGEIPLAAQAKLLRVLESGEVERVGGDRTLTLDVRVVAATHRDLAGRVRERAFREDLLYRLDVFPICLPPLRERPSEIAPLARHILQDLGRRLGQVPPVLNRRAIERLKQHDWPGNVRELRNVLERSMILRTGTELEIDLGARPRASGAVSSFDDGARACIEAALVAAGGRIYGASGAAARLRLKPTTLVSKMKRLGIGGPDERRRAGRS